MANKAIKHHFNCSMVLVYGAPCPPTLSPHLHHTETQLSGKAASVMELMQAGIPTPSRVKKTRQTQVSEGERRETDGGEVYQRPAVGGLGCSIVGWRVGVMRRQMNQAVIPYTPEIAYRSASQYHGRLGGNREFSKGVNSLAAQLSCSIHRGESPNQGWIPHLLGRWGTPASFPPRPTSLSASFPSVRALDAIEVTASRKRLIRLFTSVRIDTNGLLKHQSGL